VPISRGLAKVPLQAEVDLYSNLKLCLISAAGTDFPDVYAKVLALAPQHPGNEALQVRLELTSMPEAARAFLASIEATPVTS